MLWARRALAVAGAFLAAGCGGGEEAEEAALPPPPECAPALYEAIRKEASYPEQAVAAAREGKFNLRRVHLRLEPPIDWNQNPIDSTAFQGKLQDLTWLDPLLYAYWTGEPEALAQARDIVLDWVGANPFVNPYVAGHERGESKPWIDKVSAERAPFIALVASAADCEGMLSARQQAVLRESLRTHGQFLADDAHYHSTNHGLYVDQGLDLLARLAPDVPEAETWEEAAEKRFLANLRSHLAGDEGFWLEHSAQYQVAITRLVERFTELGDVGGELDRLADRMREVTGLMLEPDGQLVLYGDSNYVQSTDEDLQVAAGLDGLYTLPRSGLAFVRGQDPAAYLAVFSSFHSATHKDADELSFDLFDSGHRIVSDTGLYHKDLDEYFDFQSSPAAHSVLRAETDVPITDANAYGSGIDASGEGDGWYAVLARNPLLEQLGIEHRRLFLYRPGYALIVVDEVRSDVVHSYERLFQLGPDLEVAAHGAVLQLTADGLDGTLTSTSSAPETVELARGQKDPLAGFVFPNFREAVPRYVASYESEAADFDAVATFGFEGRGLTVTRVSDDSGEIHLEAELDGADAGEIVVDRSGRELSVEVPPALAP